MKKHTYKGLRAFANSELVVTVDGLPLDPRHDIRDHSPDGFECGYSGSGPAQLALAILMHHFEGDVALATQFYQDFKFHCIAKLSPTNSWEITTAQVEAVIEEIAKEWQEPIYDDVDAEGGR